MPIKIWDEMYYNVLKLSQTITIPNRKISFQTRVDLHQLGCCPETEKMYFLSKMFFFQFPVSYTVSQVQLCVFGEFTEPEAGLNCIFCLKWELKCAFCCIYCPNAEPNSITVVFLVWTIIFMLRGNWLLPSLAEALNAAWAPAGWGAKGGMMGDGGLYCLRPCWTTSL